MTKGILYIVPTPVGNLGDITLRALDVLRDADVIFAEDTRTTGILLQHFDIAHGRMVSCHKFNEQQRLEEVCARLSAGEKVALVSDAGTPGVSDPGFLLARECASRGFEVQTLPGATACIPALVSSGLSCDKFCFEGFLPQKKGRQSAVEALRGEERTMVFYESPRRLVKTLEQMSAVFGAQRRCCVSREISKVHEEHLRGTLQEALQHFTQCEPRGEIVLVVAGCRMEGRKEHRNKYKEEPDSGEGEEER